MFVTSMLSLHSMHFSGYQCYIIGMHGEPHAESTLEAHIVCGCVYVKHVGHSHTNSLAYGQSNLHSAIAQDRTIRNKKLAAVQIKVEK